MELLKEEEEVVNENVDITKKNGHTNWDPLLLVCVSN